MNDLPQYDFIYLCIILCIIYHWEKPAVDLIKYLYSRQTGKGVYENFYETAEGDKPQIYVVFTLKKKVTCNGIEGKKVSFTLK